MRFFEIKAGAAGPKPPAAQSGSFIVNGGGSVTFQANRVPVAADDGGVTTLNQALNLTSASLLANDSDPDGDALSVVSVSATSTNGGAVSLSLGTVTYTPVNGFSGYDRFSYTISDGRSGSATAQVEVYVSATVLPAANHLAITPSGGGYRLLFAAVPGQTYDLQRTTDLTTAIWTTLTTVVAPPSGIIEYTDSTPPLPNAFYKIVSH